jgi:hypothetical protein
MTDCPSSSQQIEPFSGNPSGKTDVRADSFHVLVCVCRCDFGVSNASAFESAWSIYPVNWNGRFVSPNGQDGIANSAANQAASVFCRRL